MEQNKEKEKELESLDENQNEDNKELDKEFNPLDPIDEPKEEKKKLTLEKGISMAKFYSLATQGIINMVVMAGVGYLIGYFTLPNTPWPPIFAIIGLLCGLFTFISYVLYLSKGDNKHDTKNKG